MGISKIKHQNDSFCTSIVYTLDPDEKTDNFTNGMLSNNRIRGLLAHTCEINNNVQTLTYTITKGIPLSTLIRQSLRKNVMLTILKNIADILLRCEEYMMDTDHVILDEDYIFVDSNTLDVSMIMTPTNKPYGKPFRAFVKSCIVTGVFDLSEDTSYVMQISNFLNISPNASVKETSDFFNKLINSADIPVNIPNHVINQVQANTPSAPPPAVNIPTPVMQQQIPTAPPAPMPIPSPTAAVPMPDAAKAPTDKEQKKVHRFGGLFEKKKKKAETPNSSFSGMAVPGMASPAVPAMPEPQPEKSTKKGKKADPIPQSSLAQVNMAAQQSNAQPMNVPEYDGYAGAEIVYNNINSGSEATVILGQENSSAGNFAGFLEQKNGTSVQITKDFFFIGKGTNTSIVNDLVIRNDKVSRNHAVIECSNGHFYVKDNNSLNGTFINGSRITPNVRTELRHNDIIIFANEEYSFSIKRI